MEIARAEPGGLPGFSLDLAQLASSDRITPESVAPPRDENKAGKNRRGSHAPPAWTPAPPPAPRRMYK